MTKIHFNEIWVRGKKKGICPKCKKPASRSVKFWQTHNPFNKNKDGTIKTKDEILKECQQELFAWKEEPVYHARCEPKG